MFGFWKGRAEFLGKYSIKVYQGSGMDASVDYSGKPLRKADSLFIRGLYVSKTLHTVSNTEFTGLILSAIADGCLHLENERGIDIGTPAGISLVPGGRMLTARFHEHTVNVVKGPDLDMPVIQTNLPQSATPADLAVAMIVFSEQWLHDFEVVTGDFAAKAFLQFFIGLLSYYQDDPTGFKSQESVFQAPIKAYMLAHSSFLGFAGLAEEDSH